MVEEPRTLAALSARLADLRGDATALVMTTGKGEESLSFRALHEEAIRVASGLSALGFRRGDRLAVWLPNTLEWVVLQLAAARLGVLVIAINTRFRAGELVHVLGTSAARGIVFAPGFLEIDFAGILGTALDQMRDAGPARLEHAITVDTWRQGKHQVMALAGVTVTAYDELRRDGSDRLETGKPSDLASAFTTSGTTAAPKLAGHDQQSIVRHSLSAGREFDLRPGDTLFCPLPLCGIFGFNAIFAGLARGATCISQSIVAGREGAELMSLHGVTHFVGSGPMLENLLAQETEFRQTGKFRRGIVSVFAGNAVDLVREADERMGGCWGDVYGSSECFALMAFWPPGTPIEHRATKGGHLVSDEIEIRVVDSDSGERLPTGSRGELQFRGYNVLAEYFANPEATVAAFTGDGWYRTGDLGYLVDERSFIFLSRLKDSLRLHGYLVDPLEIEDYVGRHEAVRIAQVVGVKGPAGDVPVAFVQPRPGTACTPDEIRAFCRQRMASYKVPEHIFLVDTFPTTVGTNGAKIQKGRLREMAEELIAAEQTN